MKKFILMIACVFLTVVLVACNSTADVSSETQESSANANIRTVESEMESESTEISAGISTEISTDISTEVPTDSSTEIKPVSWDMSWEELVMYAPEYMGIKKIEEEFNGTNTDLSKWFVDYNGEKIQRINDPEDSAGPAKRKDIIYYNTEESDIQLILKAMIDAMIQPLTEPDENRAYVIERYELKEQKIKEINESVWLVRSIRGYYSFEGVDTMVTMEDVLSHEKDMKDGMINFVSEGSASTGQYILIKYGSVYRLQKAELMGGFGVEM